MRLLTDEPASWAERYQTEYPAEHEDALLNRCFRNCRILSDHQQQIMKENGLTEADILYSAYYWGHQFLKRAETVGYADEGFEQWHFQLIEQIEACCGEADLALLEQIENDMI